MDSDSYIESFTVIHIHPQITTAAFNADRTLTEAEWQDGQLLPALDSQF